MFTIDELIQPDTLSEAAERLTESPDIVVLEDAAF